MFTTLFFAIYQRWLASDEEAPVNDYRRRVNLVIVFICVTTIYMLFPIERFVKFLGKRFWKIPTETFKFEE